MGVFCSDRGKLDQGMLFVAFLGLALARERGEALPVFNSWVCVHYLRAILMSPQGPQRLGNACLMARHYR